MTSIGCKRRRASLALESVLAPVVHGALAAALAASMLAASEFGFVARLFLRLLLALVMLGLVDGLLFFPIILSILGPAAEVSNICFNIKYVYVSSGSLNDALTIYAQSANNVFFCF